MVNMPLKQLKMRGYITKIINKTGGTQEGKSKTDATDERGQRKLNCKGWKTNSKSKTD